MIAMIAHSVGVQRQVNMHTLGHLALLGSRFALRTNERLKLSGYLGIGEHLLGLGLDWVSLGEGHLRLNYHRRGRRLRL
jgi:hypothetical protein